MCMTVYQGQQLCMKQLCVNRSCTKIERIRQNCLNFFDIEVMVRLGKYSKKRKKYFK